MSSDHSLSLRPRQAVMRTPDKTNSVGLKGRYDLLVHHRDFDTKLVEVIENGVNTGSLVVKPETLELLRFVFMNRHGLAFGEILRDQMALYSITHFNVPWKQGVEDLLWDYVGLKTRREGDAQVYLIWLLRELSGQWVVRQGEECFIIKAEEYQRKEYKVFAADRAAGRGNDWLKHVERHWMKKELIGAPNAPTFDPAAFCRDPKTTSALITAPLTPTELAMDGVAPSTSPQPAKTGIRKVPVNSLILPRGFSPGEVDKQVKEVLEGTHARPEVDPFMKVVAGAKTIAALRMLGHKTVTVRIVPEKKGEEK